MRILVATSNPHKIEEIAAVLDACEAQRSDQTPDEGHPAFKLCSLADVGADDLPEPVEDGETFEANAVIKARCYAEATGMWCLADDSGLEVDALGGEPGVRSARYAGATGSRAEVDLANNRLLLERLGDLPREQRAARFVCAMALARPDADGNGTVVATVRGTVEGRILGPGDAGFNADDPPANFHGRGSNGFGYDPLFHVPRLGKTTAELTPERKNAISHRGDASRKMHRRLRELA